MQQNAKNVLEAYNAPQFLNNLFTSLHTNIFKYYINNTYIFTTFKTAEKKSKTRFSIKKSMMAYNYGGFRSRDHSIAGNNRVIDAGRSLTRPIARSQRVVKRQMYGTVEYV